jgi:thiol:disulfide interchange protein
MLFSARKGKGFFVMTEILAAASQGMQNVYTPLSLKAHFIFCIAATAVYLLQFYRRGSWHYLLIMAAVDATFATQTSLCKTSGSIAVLGLVEIVLLIFAAVFYAKYAREQKAAEAAENAEADEENERRHNAEKIQRAHDKQIVDNAFEDGDGE